jgi:hypothetical protein
MADRMWFKGRAAVALDAWYASAAEERLRDAQAWLSDPDLSFADMTGRLNLAFEGKDIRLSDADTDHPEYAFDYPIPDGALQGDDFEGVVRQGYLEAIGLALEHDPPVPILTSWMNGAGNSTYEMHITDGANNVSVTLFIPEVEGGSTHAQSPEGWKIVGDGNGGAETVQTSGPDASAQPSLRSSPSSS